MSDRSSINAVNSTTWIAWELKFILLKLFLSILFFIVVHDLADVFEGGVVGLAWCISSIIFFIKLDQ